MAPRTMAEPVGSRLSLLDERLRALQESTGRDAAAALEGVARVEAAESRLEKAVAEHSTAHAVMAQWMRDWTTEVSAWRSVVDRRIAEGETRQEAMGQDVERARGALRVAVWVFATALTLVTGALSSVLARALGEIVSRVSH